MDKNIRLVIINFFVIVVMFFLATFYFIHAFIAREVSAPPIPAPERAPKPAVSVSQYEIPSNAIPTTREIKEEVAREDTKKKDREAMHAEAEKIVRKDTAVLEKEQASKTAAKTVKSGAASSFPRHQNDVPFPTHEERKNMERRGIICY